jgi:hypothetical protein
MVSVFASSVVDRGFEPRSVQTKDYAIGMCCFLIPTKRFSCKKNRYDKIMSLVLETRNIKEKKQRLVGSEYSAIS